MSGEARPLRWTVIDPYAAEAAGQYARWHYQEPEPRIWGQAVERSVRESDALERRLAA